MLPPRICVLIALGCAQMKYVTSAPCPELAANNSSRCERSSTTKRKAGKDPLSTIISGVNSTEALLESLLYGILSDDAGGSVSNQEIVFPDSHKQTKPVERVQPTSPCIDGLTLCESIESYPYHRLKNILPITSHHNEFFGVDEEVQLDIANRNGLIEDRFICASISTTIFPQAGKNKNNKWKYIVNQGAHDPYIQGVRIETCLKKAKPCNLISSAPVGYVANCKQKYLLRRLLSISEDGQPVPDTFRIPSACCCSFSRDSDFLADFGRSVTPAVKGK